VITYFLLGSWRVTEILIFFYYLIALTGSQKDFSATVAVFVAIFIL
jgi:hypothetical protein